MASTGDREFGSALAFTHADHMAHYKAYFIGRDGRFIKAKDIIQDDDPAAIIAARAMIGMHAIELWERDRRIVQFEAIRQGAPDLQPSGATP